MVRPYQSKENSLVKYILIGLITAVVLIILMAIWRGNNVVGTYDSEIGKCRVFTVDQKTGGVAKLIGDDGGRFLYIMADYNLMRWKLYDFRTRGLVGYLTQNIITGSKTIVTGKMTIPLSKISDKSNAMLVYSGEKINMVITNKDGTLSNISWGQTDAESKRRLEEWLKFSQLTDGTNNVSV